MADLTLKVSNFISRSVQQGVSVLEGIEELRTLRNEANVLEYTTSIVDEDFLGDNGQPSGNDHLTRQDLVNAFVAIDAIVALLQATTNTHYKSLYKLKR
jgi:hypothetical protein